MNEKLNKLINKAKEQRTYLEAKEKEDKSFDEDTYNKLISQGFTEKDLKDEISKGTDLKKLLNDSKDDEKSSKKNEDTSKEEDSDDDDKKGNKYELSGVVKKITPLLSEKSESGGNEIVAVVRIPSAKTFNVMGKNIKISAGNVIPVIATPNVKIGDKVTLSFNVNKLMFDISE